MDAPNPTVAVIGIGRMGAAMAARISRAGFNIVVWNRDKSKAARVANDLGVPDASSAAEAAAHADVIVSSLADDNAVEQVYLGEGGIVNGIKAGAVAVETSTVDPETVVSVGEKVDATGAGFLDCPVSGSVSTVEAGALTIMAGGDLALIQRVRPVLEALSSQVVHAGGRGSGAATKLAVNGLVHGLNVALAEALVLAEKAGVARSTAYEVFANGAGGAPFVQYKRAAYENPADAQVAFSIDLVAKDLELITRLGDRVGAPLAQANTGLELVLRAVAEGYGDRDLSAIAVFLRGGED